jgi:ubiquinone/menaquinone biosynthesis C-methylase UbiE
MISERRTNLLSMDSQHVVDYYDRISNHTPFKTMAKNTLKFGVKNGKLLDNSCGPGHLLVELAKLEPDLELYGLDISHNMLNACRKKLLKNDLEERIKLFEGSAYDLPFPADSFDMVVNTLSLHCIDDAPRFFEQMVKVLKPGAIGYVYAFRRDIPFRKIFPLFSSIELWWRKRFFGVDEGIGYIIDASYTPEEIEGFLNDLPVSNIIINKKRFSMTILFQKEKE